MRIVDVNGFYAEAGGGVRRYVDAKFASASRAGHDLTVIAPGAQTRVEPRPGGQVAWIESPLDAFRRPIPPVQAGARAAVGGDARRRRP